MTERVLSKHNDVEINSMKVQSKEPLKNTKKWHRDSIKIKFFKVYLKVGQDAVRPII